MNENRKSACVWIAFIDGWYELLEGSLVDTNYPFADDMMREKCVRIYDAMGKRKAKLYAYGKGLDGRLV
jgi:hypothetical protein